MSINRAPTRKQQELYKQLDRIALEDRQFLLTLWRKAMDRPPPKHLSASIMRKILSYEIQAQAYGALSKTMIKQLQKAQGSASSLSKPPPLTLKCGAHLVREWQGKTYHVEVCETGFIMRGKAYKSLSAIARKITGAHWSGPRFFGLTKTISHHKGAA